MLGVLQTALDYTKQLERGYANIPGDAPTMWGLNSEVHPQLAPKILSKTLSWEEASSYLAKEYYYTIPGVGWLEQNMPDLLWLIYIGKVHGSGDEHLIELVQRWIVQRTTTTLSVDGILGEQTLDALESLSYTQRDLLREAIQGSVESLATRRARSVGMLPESIRARVVTEHRLAKSFIVNTLPEPGKMNGFRLIAHPVFDIYIREKRDEEAHYRRSQHVEQG